MKIAGTSAEEWLAIPHEPGEIQWLGGDSSRRKAELWALVLESRGIPFRLERSGHGLQLLVPAAYMDAAVEELSLFEEENRDWPPLPRDIPSSSDNTMSTLSILVLVAVFHNLIRLRVWLPGKLPPDWIAIGSADSEKILQGQWWRLVTALTLHADFLHLLGNLAIGGIFIVFLCRYLGSGLAWAMLLGAGVLGNFGNALLQPVNHQSIGSSTLVFGAVGLLASLNITGMRQLSWKNCFLPFAGAAALLALLGTEGERADLGAHVCGFASGVVLGLAAGFLVGRFGRPGMLLNVLLSSAAACTVATAWFFAVG
ncbi:MAG: rhomboid family intramembrane serine protease [Geobacteraceae bacterium]|nr:rhomboid family intramembrane serine protease [Geobacteraceae bacterium]